MVELDTVESGTSSELILTPVGSLLMVTCIDVTIHKRQVAQLAAEMSAYQQTHKHIAIDRERALQTPLPTP